MTIQKSNFMV